MVTKKERNYLLGGALLVFLIWTFGFGGMDTMKKWFPLPTTGGNGGNVLSWTDQMREDYNKGIGTFLFRIKVYDSCDPTTARTLTTHYTAKLYRKPSGTWIPGPTLDADGENFALKPEDNGKAYYVIKCPAAVAYYVSYEQTRANDPYIVGVEYTDVDGDGTKDFAFKYDCAGHQLPGSGYPEIDMIAYELTYDASLPAFDAIANFNATSTTSTWYLDWFSNFSAVNTGRAISSVEFKINITDLTPVQLKSMAIPGMGTVDGSSFTRTLTGTEILWTYTFSYNFWNAYYLYRLTDSSNKFYWTTKLETTLSGFNNTLCTLTVYYLVAPTGASTSKTDGVQIYY